MGAYVPGIRQFVTYDRVLEVMRDAADKNYGCAWIGIGEGHGGPVTEEDITWGYCGLHVAPATFDRFALYDVSPLVWKKDRPMTDDELRQVARGWYSHLMQTWSE